MNPRNLLWLLLPLVACSTPEPVDHPAASELIVCGDQHVIILDADQSTTEENVVVWRWHPDSSAVLPAEYKDRYLATIDDAKPMAQNEQIIVSSSSGGVVVIERATHEVVAYTTLGNAHSIEALPNDRMVVAGSTNPQGNRVAVFDRVPDAQPLFSDSLYSGHGVVWDEGRQLLYALGYDELRAYELVDWYSDQPALRQKNRWTIPGAGGHDLVQPPYDSSTLILSEHHSVWSFDKKTGTFTEYAPLTGMDNVKGIALDVHGPESLAFIKAETSWWSNRVYLGDTTRYLTIDSIRLYKTRWMYGDARHVRD